MAASDNLQPQQFYHGTTARLNVGDSITPPSARGTTGRLTGEPSQHTFFTSSAYQAETYAQTGTRASSSDQYVYRVQPTGSYGKDVNHPGQPSFMSQSPLTVTGLHKKTPAPAPDYEIDWDAD